MVILNKIISTISYDDDVVLIAGDAAGMKEYIKCFKKYLRKKVSE